MDHDSGTLRTFAESVLLGGTLAEKLRRPPGGISDEDPVPAETPLAPGRSPEIAIETDAKRKKRVPPVEGMPDPSQRVRIVHSLMNHELQAVEMFAWAILRFPDAPRAFRNGLLAILAEEQKHFDLYRVCLERLGARFGQWPLSGYFWSKAQCLDTPSRFVAAMCLTFESANLDHSLDLEAAAAAAGDDELARALRVVHEDELGHVRFGWKWLSAFKPDAQTTTEAYLENVVWPLRPVLARGPTLHRESRERAGLDAEFIDLLEEAARPKALYRFEKPPAKENS